MCSFFKKQRICTKDSTKTEIRTVSDYVNKMEWVRDFLEHQGEVIAEVIVYQDNKSAIEVMEKPNLGRLRMRYIRARVGVCNEYLYIKREAKIKHLRTN